MIKKFKENKIRAEKIETQREVMRNFTGHLLVNKKVTAVKILRNSVDEYVPLKKVVEIADHAISKWSLFSFKRLEEINNIRKLSGRSVIQYKK